MPEIFRTEVISLPIGQIKGNYTTTIYDDCYHSFEGIPYGQPPVGKLRFKSPRSVKPWEGVLNCTESKIKPVQMNPLTGKAEGSEDCLYLNVYTKQFSREPMPVMVWIYGGGFYMGEATKNLYSPDYFMKEDVVVVTINYRLCALGFLSVEEPDLEIPGNAGLKDQILALKWVRDFIYYFNGDPGNITVFGCSAGAASTHYLTATKKAKFLFAKAICMSGSMLNSWANIPQKDHAYRLAVQHGYTDFNDDFKVIKFLQSLEPEKLVQHNILTDQERRNGILFPFGPCVEPYDDGDCVIPVEPKEMLKTAWGNEIPIIMGGTADEGLLMYPKLKMFPESMNAINSDLERMLPFEVRDENKDKSIEKAKMIVKAHFGDKQPSEDCLKEFIDFYSFKAFWHGFHRSLLSRLQYSKAPTYLYRFAFDSPTFNHNRKRFCGNDLKTGVAHADDAGYMWYGNYSWKLDKTSKEYKTLERMIDIFTSFAKSSDPNCIATSKINWKPLCIDEPYMGLHITDNLEYTIIPEKEKLLVWDALYDKTELI